MFKFLKNSYLERVEYHDAMVIMVVSAVLLCQHLLSYPNIYLLTIVTLSSSFLLSFMISLLDYYRVDEYWMAYLSVMLAGFLVGITELDLIISFALFLVIVLRIVKSTGSSRFILGSMAIIMVVLGYLLNMLTHLIDFLHPVVTKQMLPYYLLILFLLVVFILIEYVNMKRMIVLSLREIDENKNRIKDQVKISNNLARFVPNQIWQPIVKDNTPAHLFNKRAKLTIFFSDIVNFTHLSDNISADELTEILNTYMNRMTQVANRHGATLDKFIGDGMMCFFGADGKGSVKDNALKCVAMALDMRREMRVLRQQWQKEGFEGLSIRMGINTGFCHVGNFGTDLRMSYTVIGKEVNLAARLESAAGTDEILISQATYDYVGYEYNCTMVKNVELKGLGSIETCWKVLEPVTSELKVSQWVDYDLPGFNLHLNFKDIKSYDYEKIRGYLDRAIERVEYKKEKMDTLQ